MWIVFLGPLSPFPSNPVSEDLTGASGENFSPLLLLPPTTNCSFVRAGGDTRGQQWLYRLSESTV